MADSRDDEAPEVKADTPDTSERQKDFTRRALLRAGWVVPAVTAINIPSASAQTPTPHNDVHGDMRACGRGRDLTPTLTSTRRSPPRGRHRLRMTTPRTPTRRHRTPICRMPTIR